MANPNIYNSRLDAFDLYHKQQQSQHSLLEGPALPALGHALAGATGTAISNLAIYPLDLIITRLQVQRQFRNSSVRTHDEYEGIADALDKIYSKEGGLKAFYVGIVQDTGKSIADSFLFFLFYNYLRTNRLQKKGHSATTLPALDELLVGAMAGACSKLFTTPISNIVTRKQTAAMQSASTPGPTIEPSVRSIISDIHDEKGLQGFWSGYSASLVLTANPSITFFLYEFFKRTLLPRTQRDDPGARTTFLMAAFSKAVASALTYPFALAKKRAQAGSAPPVDPDSMEDIKTELSSASTSRDAKRAGRKTKNVAKESTVFATILRIYRTEGPEALYEGVWGEVLRGFLGHGLTMLIKERVHSLIVAAYYWVLKALQRYPSPEQLAERAKEAVGGVPETARGMIESGKEMVNNTLSSTSTSTSNTVNQGKEKVETVLDHVNKNGSADGPGGSAYEAAKSPEKLQITRPPTSVEKYRTLPIGIKSM
ncbi:putative Peroxisomal adenine nucleotide transporter 1 [Glarea lozoyensis 74030]|uniref:Putative Peroxisomal adenine nucleotide transporter 1 n=1 Tax=Glarea lozoyensis (strain ATCC 74030 / MF5533) TaxID=1104152 RepID=H0ESD2_GLAL7|nr:putative Peroxisomal adenine nucleotide transporter 1 [Glarea lozoyensis 74030]